MTPDRPLFRFHVSYRGRAGEWDSDPFWAANNLEAMRACHEAQESYMVRAFFKAQCGPDDWSAVELPDGRVLSRAEHEKEMAA